MIKNLSQLKKAMKPGVCFTIIAHCRPECVGEVRKVTISNTQGFYSIVPNDLQNKATFANNGKGSVLWWSKAPFWEFTDGLCSIYSSDKEHTERMLIMSFRLENQEVA